MAQIFVNTDNSNITNKIYNAGKVGKSAAAAEGKMKGAVVEIVGKAADFTTTKFGDAKGYTIRIEVSKVEKAGAQTTYTVSGEIVRYPATVTKSHGKGEEMVTLRPMTSSVNVEVLALRLSGVEDVAAPSIYIILIVRDPGQPIGVKRLLAVVIVQADHEDDGVY